MPFGGSSATVILDSYQELRELYQCSVGRTLNQNWTPEQWCRGGAPRGELTSPLGPNIMADESFGFLANN